MNDGAVLLLGIVVGMQLLSVVLFYAAHRQRIVERRELSGMVERMEDLSGMIERMEELSGVVERISESLTNDRKVNATLIDDLGALLLPTAPSFFDIDQEVLEMKDRVSEIEAHLDRIESAVDARAAEIEAQLDRTESAVDAKASEIEAQLDRIESAVGSSPG